jgi:Fe2+ or Zn2+ uptake regulation protein
MNKDLIYNKIKGKGGRLSRVRLAVLDIFIDSGCVVSENKIVEKLAEQKIKPNRSTIYRELTFLCREKFINKSVLAGEEYFELAGDHHHHLICLGCQSIRKIELDHHLEHQEKEIAEKNNFKNIKHSLEFYGYCQECQG